MPENSLMSQMEAHYTDDNGDVIAEAVELGSIILHLISDLHATVDKAISSGDDSLFYHVSDFYTSLAVESFSVETYRHNKDAINAQVATLKAIDVDTGNFIHEVILGSYMQLMENEFFQDQACNVLLRVLLIESITRTMNAHYFCVNPINEEHAKAQNVLITYANMHGSFHVLAMIAFLCNGEHDKYKSMNYQVEQYSHKINSELGHIIIRAASEY